MLDQTLYQKWISDKGYTEDTAPDDIRSEAKAYESCYNWYIEKMKVTAENAAIAADVWLRKYALHDSSNICLELTPEDTWHREADALAKEEVRTNPLKSDYTFWYNEFYSILKDWKYSPQGSGMYALGNPYVKASVSNCFVAPSPTDSLEGIFDTGKYMARTYAARGGVGINLNGLRPCGAKTNNAAKTSTGAASFMDFYSYITGMIGQAGRRGALMECMSVHHPDISRFIDMKTDASLQPFFSELAESGIDINDWKYSSIADRLKSTSFANVSVMISDEFMKAVKDNTVYTQRFKFNKAEYSDIVYEADATELWDTIMTAAWKSAEPGILFWDNVSKESNSNYYGDISEYEFTDPLTGELTKVSGLSGIVTATNPCGEQPLSAHDSCCLGTHYLMPFVKNAWTDKATFDFDEYKRVLHLSVRAQDNIKGIDAATLPIMEQRATALLFRRIGLGNTGLSDVLAALGYKYDSQEAYEFCETLYSFLRDTTYEASVNLAIEKGPFDCFNWELHNQSPFIQRLPKNLQDQIAKFGIRNVALLTQAPNGSMSILMRNCSSGIEPTFKLKYTRNVKQQGTGEVVQHTLYHQAAKDALIAGLSDSDLDVFIEAGDIDPESRVKLQGMLQKYIDSAISVTTNLKHDATIEQVKSLYEMAYSYGTKGFTIYRDGCRTGVLNSIKETVKNKPKYPIERPKTTDVDILKTRYKDKNYMVLVGKVNGQPIEIFGGEESGLSLPTEYYKAELSKKSRGHYSLTVQLSESDDDILKINNIGNRFPAGDIVTITRLISMSLRNGIPIDELVSQLTKSASSLYDAPAVFARILKNYIPDEVLIEKEKAKGKPCPECGSELEYKRESGCLVELCSSCTYSNSKCG